MGALFDAVSRQTVQVGSLQRALNDVASRCAELAAVKGALSKRVHALDAELDDVKAALGAARAASDACDKERELAQDEVVRLTGIASAQHDELAVRDAELARVVAERDAAASEAAAVGSALAALKIELADERAARADEAQQSEAVAAAALSMQRELEQALAACVQQRERAMRVAQQALAGKR